MNHCLSSILAFNIGFDFSKSKNNSTSLLFCFFIFLTGIGQVSYAQSSLEKSIKERIESRKYPSVFQAWSQVENEVGDNVSLAAKHDLIWQGASSFNLKWNNSFNGLATGFIPETIAFGLEKRKELLQKNPNMIFLLEIRFYDAFMKYLPTESPFWMHDSLGKLIMGWKEGNYPKLDYRNKVFQNIIVQQAKAAVESGVFDGIMLDRWSEGSRDSSAMSLLKDIRNAIGEEKLIIVNSNDNIIPNSAKYVNGLFMECCKANNDDKNWEKIENTLRWAESNLKEPHVNCLETWYKYSRNDLNRMRATTTLSLTCSNGYALFSDPNELPTADHLHNWYSFWDIQLGKPTGKGFKRDDGIWQREFTNGIVVYNPPLNNKQTLKFKQKLKRVSDGVVGTSFVMDNLDGDIFLYVKNNNH